MDSAVLYPKISKEFFQDIGEKKFFETVKRIFPKRKMLIINLKADKESFRACNIGEKPEKGKSFFEQWTLIVDVKVSPLTLERRANFQ